MDIKHVPCWLETTFMPFFGVSLQQDEFFRYSLSFSLPVVATVSDYCNQILRAQHEPWTLHFILFMNSPSVWRIRAQPCWWTWPLLLVHYWLCITGFLGPKVQTLQTITFHHRLEPPECKVATGCLKYVWDVPGELCRSLYCFASSVVSLHLPSLKLYWLTL